jgi:hypothetical protein
MGSRTLAYVRSPRNKWKVLNAFRCEETAAICASNLAEQLGQSLITLAIVQPFEEKFATQVFYVDEEQDISLVKQFYVKDETELEETLKTIPEPVFVVNKGLVYPEGIERRPPTTFRQTQQELNDLIFRPVATASLKTSVTAAPKPVAVKAKAATPAPVTVTPIVAKPVASVAAVAKPATPIVAKPVPTTVAKPVASVTPILAKGAPVATAAPQIIQPLIPDAEEDLAKIREELNSKLQAKIKSIASRFQEEIVSLIENDIKVLGKNYPNIFNDRLKILPANVISILEKSISDVARNRLLELKEINQPLQDLAVDNKSTTDITVSDYCNIMILYVLSLILPPEPYFKPLTVWRWVDRSTERKIGDVILWPLFTSTSLSKKAALTKPDYKHFDGYLLEITIPARTPFLYTDGLPGEYTLLLPPCTKTIVTSGLSTDSGIKEVKAEVLTYTESAPQFLSNLDKIKRLMVLKYYSTIFQPFDAYQLNYWNVNMIAELKLLKCGDTKPKQKALSARNIQIKK